MQPDFICIYWGKSQPASDSGPGWHPAAYHCLDVAAAGRCILSAKPSLLRRIASLASISPAQAERWLLLALALHDLGKFADCFQCIVEHRWHATNRDVWEAKGAGPQPMPHGVAGWVLWQDGIGERVAEVLGWEPEAQCTFERWLLATFGHHGRPISISDASAKTIATPTAIAAALEFAETAALLIYGDAGRIDADAINEQGLQTASWLVSGLSVMADWIGSNQGWFPYNEPNLSLEQYWQEAQFRAKNAVASAGLTAIDVAASYGLAQALPAVESADATPLQEWASNVELPAQGPVLAFLEDLTGSGKTEAALILAHRLMSNGHASGLYWALPTQATANALYGRLRHSYRSLFGDGSVPSLALAHSSTDLQEDYKNSRFTPAFQWETGRAEAPYSREDGETASALCAEWLASDRRRSLLADIGVGTVDQALLGALPVKFQSLRLAALAERVLVVDEAHSYDRYTTRLLSQLLAFQAALGGSAIVLSATLTTKTKGELLTAFAAGAGWVNPHWCEKAGSATDSFPLASILGAPELRGSCSPVETPLRPLRGTRRDLPVVRLESSDEAIASLVSHARAGRCAVWIRNTVQDAIDGAEALANAGLELAPWLFHSRFTLADRAVIERRVLDAFGKTSGPGQRAPGGMGRILVATQVIEQSLDIDLDAMVSDLAPVDLIIQRAGRLHRHDRGQRRAPVLEIVGPRPVQYPPASWYSELFPRASFVYSHPGHLWRTMKVLEEAGALPLESRNPRELLHAVFDDEDYPDAFERAVAEWAGRCSVHTALAAARGLDPATGYSDQQRGFYDESRSPTRLGDEMRTMRLARWVDGKLLPWADGDAGEARAWRVSEIQLRAYKARARGAYPAEIENAAAAIEASWAGRAQTALLLPLVAWTAGWSGTLLGEDDKSIPVMYDNVRGLRFLETPPSRG